MKYMPLLIPMPQEVRGLFLDISKVFDQVYHKGLVCKIKCIGVKGDLLTWIGSFYSKNSMKRVVLNGQDSEWLTFKAGVPQSSILGQLFCFIYINDLSF